MYPNIYYFTFNSLLVKINFTQSIRSKLIFVTAETSTHLLVILFLGMARGIVVQEKSDTVIPVPDGTLSPPEGNTTFLDGTTWCVAQAGVSQADLQNALDWACGLGMADCKAIQKGGPCYDPDTLLSHASFAFNSYYQTNGNSDIACNFGGTASLTKQNPSKFNLNDTLISFILLEVYIKKYGNSKCADALCEG